MPYQCSWHIARTIVRWHCHCSFPCRKFKLDSWIRNATGMVWCWIWLVVVTFHSLLGKLVTIYLERLLGSDFQTFCLCLLEKTKQLKAQPKLVDLGRETSHSVHLVWDARRLKQNWSFQHQTGNVPCFGSNQSFVPNRYNIATCVSLYVCMYACMHACMYVLVVLLLSRLCLSF